MLFLSDHTCCICKVRGKDVQIHHIDGDPANNTADNLAILCLDCHSLVSGPRGLGKSYKPGEVRRYKRGWELQVQDRRKIHHPIIRYQRELISQIDLIVCEILALDPRSSRISVLFKLLYELNLWRGTREISTKLLDGMGHLAIMSGLSEDRISKHIPQFLWQMCWHFVGPTKVPMDRQDGSHVKRCLEIMETLAKFTCEFEKGRETIRQITVNAEKFFEIALWYSNRDLAQRVLVLYEKAMKACRADEKKKFTYGLWCVRISLGNLRALLKEQKPRWRELDEKLSRIAKNTRVSNQTLRRTHSQQAARW
jgi:hypothetical protein